MAASNAVWGIDIGQCGLKALKLQVAGDQVEAVAFDYVEHAKILSQPDAERPTLIRDALEKFLSRNDVANDGIVVSVPGQQTFARFTKLPPVETKRIPEIVQFEASQQIPFDMDAVVWDYQTFSSPDSPDIEVGIFAMKRDLIAKILTHFTEMGLEPTIVQAGPLALYNALRYDGHIGDGATIILDVGAENSDLVVAEGDSIWSRNIPLGGNNFTEALVKAFKLSFSKAENLKRTAATSKYARQIFQAMRPVFADLVGEIQRSIGFYTSTHRHAKLERMIGMGNAFKLPGLQKFLQQNLGMPVERPKAFGKLAATQTASAPQFLEHLLSFGTAYGLALQGLELASVTSNLLPPEVIKQAMWRKKRLWFAAAAACLLLAPGAPWLRYSMDTRALGINRGNAVRPMNDAKQANEIIENGVPGNPPAGEYAKYIDAAAKALVTEYNQKNQRSAAEQQRVESILELQKDKALWLRILAVIHDALPERDHQLRIAGETPTLLKAAYKNIARAKRTEIYIDSFLSRFSDDVYNEPEIFDDAGAAAAPLGAANSFGAPAGNLAGAVPGLVETKAGFVVTLLGWTPNDGGYDFIYSRFVSVLEAKERKDLGGFYLDKVKSVEFVVRNSPEAAGTPGGPGRPAFQPGLRGGGFGGRRTRRSEGASGHGGARSVRRPAPMTPFAPRPRRVPPRALAGGATGTQSLYIDSFLEESMDQDWTFQVTLVVIKGAPPADPGAGITPPPVGGPAAGLR